LADTNKVIQTEYDYEPFGNTTTTGSANKNAYKFTAREDDGTGLYYYRARYYHPALGRFVSEDPIHVAEEVARSYQYVLNDPLTYSDPSGQSPVAIALLLLLEAKLHEHLAIKSEEVFPDFPDRDQDRERHCWVNCVSTRLHGGGVLPSSVASAAKELRDLTAGAIQGHLGRTAADSVRDMYANIYGQAAAVVIFRSCEEQCKECPVNRQSGQ
jgi:RHS repeat-associated protein